MERAALTIALVLGLAPALCAGVEIVAVGDRLDVIAAEAPVSEVLDGLARKTRMKVVYEGAVPRTPVTVELRGRTPAEAVLDVLEGLGLNYALVLDLSGTEVETLMIVGTGAGRASVGGVTSPSRSDRIRDAPHANPEKVAEESDEPPPPPAEEVSVPTGPAAAVEVEKVDENAKPSVVGPLNPARGPRNASPFAPGPAVPPPPSPGPPSGD